MNQTNGLSRRGLFRTAAAVPVAGALAADLAAAQPITAPQARVAATILRTSQSRTAPEGLRVGLRISVMANAFRMDDRVIVVDPVDFHASPADLRQQIVTGVQQQVQDMLADHQPELTVDAIAVQVFGGPL
jgi:hypothetical protein